MVLAVSFGVVKLLPVFKMVPPLAAAYQFTEPALAVACKVTLSQPVALVELVTVGAPLLIYAVTGTRVEVQEKLVTKSNENSVTATGQLMLLGF